MCRSRRSKVILLERNSRKLGRVLVARSHWREHDKWNEWQCPPQRNSCLPFSRNVCYQNRSRKMVRKPEASYFPSCIDDQVKRCSEQQSSVPPSQNHLGRRVGQSTTHN